MAAHPQKFLRQLRRKLTPIGVAGFARIGLAIAAIALVRAIEPPRSVARLQREALTSNTPFKSDHNSKSISTAGSVAKDDVAAGAFAEAEKLRATWEEAALRQSVEKYEEAASAWQFADLRKAATALQSAGDVCFLLSDYQRALGFYERTLEISRQTHELVKELETLNNIGYVYIGLGENRKALGYETKVMDYCKRLPAVAGDFAKARLEAQALNNIGEIYYGLGDLKGSLKIFAQAMALWTSLNDQRGLALVNLNLGYSYNDTGHLAEATDHYRRSLSLWREVGDHRGEALAGTALGGIYSLMGDKQAAIESHQVALAVFRRIGNHQGEAAALNGIAQAYEDLNDYQTALEHYGKAFELYQMVGNRDFVGLTRYYVGRAYFLLKQPAPARAAYLEALDVTREVGDRQIEAHILKGLGILDSSEGDNSAAVELFRKAQDLYGRVGDRRNQAYTLNCIGHVYSTSGELQTAVTYFQRALPLIRATQDRMGEVLTLYNLANVERERGNLEAALAFIKESVKLIEASRTGIDSKELRTSYFAREHKHYELYIDLLMQMRQRQGADDYATAAFLASERARARSLLDVLTEERSDPDRGGDDSLLSRERTLERLLEANAEYRTRLLSTNPSSSEANEISQEIRKLSQEYEKLRTQVAEQNPRYAAITQSSPLTLQQVQAHLPADTLLLEFALGNERSYLWVVSPTSISSHELPGRAIIERAAGKVYDLLIARQLSYEGAAQPGQVSVADADVAYFKEAAALSSTLLGPIAGQLGSSRLLIVADGGLQYIPFDALPVPVVFPVPDQSAGSEDASVEQQLLIDNHEIVELPSFSILAAIRLEKAPTLLPTRTVAVLADPVFDRADPRVAQTARRNDASQPLQAVADTYVQRAMRGLSDEGRSAIPRLPGSLREAKTIMAITTTDEGTMAVDFDASRERILSEDLQHYRIVHFATHGILDRENPEASGLILSLVDRDGNPQNGYLPLRDIYRLDMRAELVVLSACRTGLGRSVEGEGLIGLTRGFIYAGSESVVASLWKVDDEATAELMKNFYTSLLRDGLPPGAALRSAKQAVRKQNRWRSPYFWAAFVLQGEYSETFALPRTPWWRSRVVALVAAALGLAGLLLLLWQRKRLKWH